MKNYVHNSKYFCGNKISDYGIQNARVDYGTLAKAFDAVLVNDITKLFYNTISGEYMEPEMVNGAVDNSEEIEQLSEQLEELEDRLVELIKEEQEESAEYKELEAQEEEKRAAIEELERQQDETIDVFQYYIVSDAGAQLLKDLTDEIVYYLPFLDCYIWGVTHFGTSWDYVLTDIKIELPKEE